MRLKDSFIKRRSAYNFKEDFVMNDLDFETIIELVRYAPTVYNTQGVRYLVTTDKEKQAKLKELCFGQHKIYSASGVILILHEKNFLDESNVQKVYRPMVSLGMMGEDDYNVLTSRLKDFREALDDRNLELEIYRNTFTVVGVLLSAIAALGFDSCPMHVHNLNQVRELFNIPDNLEIMFMVTVGKSVEKNRPPGYRHRVEELLTFEKFRGNNE